MSKPRISYVDPANIKDEAMLAEFDRCAREGTPRPESQAIRAHVPAVFWSFANSWRDVFKNGVADHAIKELCRIYVSRSVKCEYCGNQRSMKAASLPGRFQSSRGSMAQFRLPPGAISKAVAHRSVEELWLFTKGKGRLWRNLGAREEVIEVGPGVSISIPVGAHFQFRCDGTEPLEAVGVTMPPWPGVDEAYEVEGIW